MHHRYSWATAISRLRTPGHSTSTIRNSSSVLPRHNRQPLIRVQHNSRREFLSSSTRSQPDRKPRTTQPQDLRAHAEAIHNAYIAKMESGRLSNLDLMDIADSFPYPNKPSQSAAYTSLIQTLYTFIWRPSSQTLGYIPSSTIPHLLAVPESIRGPITIDHDSRTIHIFDTLPTEPQRTAAVGGTMSYLRDHNTFSILRGWRNELWPVYGGTDDEVLFSIERSATGLLGVTRYGVHMNAYIPPPNGGQPGDMKLWIPRRSLTKETYPGMLDNTVAGGLMTGEDPFECIVREADEEASLPEALMRDDTKLKSAGIVSLIHITGPGAGGEVGQIYPKVDWVYDLELGNDNGEQQDIVVPAPKDGEVAGFELMSVDQVKDELSKGQFKPNCALIMLGFFIRHGILTRENEVDFEQIVEKMHRKLPFPGPHHRYFR